MGVVSTQNKSKPKSVAIVGGGLVSRSNIKFLCYVIESNGIIIMVIYGKKWSFLTKNVIFFKSNQICKFNKIDLLYL